MKRILTIAIMTMVWLDAFGMKSDFVFDIKDVSLQCQGEDSIAVTMTLDIIQDGVAKGCAVVLQPWVGMAQRRYDLVPISFYRFDDKGKRYEVRKDGGAASMREDEVKLVCGFGKGIVKVSGVIGCFNRTDPVELYVEVVECRKKDRRLFVESRKVALYTPEPFPEFYPEFFTSYVDSTDVYTRTIKVPFNAEYSSKNVFDVHQQLNDAAVYLLKDALRPIIKSPNTRMKSVTFRGYSDLKGSANDNLKKCQARLASLGAYWKKDKFFGKLKVNTVAVGEDWDTMYGWFKNTYWTNVDTVANVVYDNISKDGKEKKMFLNEVFWKNLVEDVFPLMDRTECEVTYDILPYSSLLERWNVVNENRKALSPYDYSCLLKAQDMFSSGWFEITSIFVKEYPECQEALLNALAGDLSRGRVDVASNWFRYLDEKDSRTVYYKAIWYMYQGQWEKSHELLQTIEGKDYNAAKSSIEKIYWWNNNPQPWVRKLYRNNHFEK